MQLYQFCGRAAFPNVSEYSRARALQELESREDAIRSKEDSSAKQEQLLRLLKIEVGIVPPHHSQRTHLIPYHSLPLCRLARRKKKFAN